MGFSVFFVFACGRQCEESFYTGERIQAWMDHYGLTTDHFQAAERFDRHYSLEQAFEEGDRALYTDLFVYSADSALAIDLDSYHLVLEDTPYGLFSPGREVDMEVGLIDFERGVRSRLLFCGTPCLFEEAGFHPDGHILVAGFVENEQGWHPCIWKTSRKEAFIEQRLAQQTIPVEDLDYIHRVRLPHIRFWFEDITSENRPD